MGRTKRIRLKRKLTEKSRSLDHELEQINLLKWLRQNRWQNETQLRLKSFPFTGRGVTSSKSVKENEILISIPYDCVITFNTLQTNLSGIISPVIKLKIQDLLTLFLVIEKQKERSIWREYINSLPCVAPPLPWLGTAEEVALYPADLQVISRKTREEFQESMYRVKKSIEKHSNCVLNENLFKWGYVLVNTRAVYVDPCIVCDKNDKVLDGIIEEPSMALCPFLDMFNHHFLAKTDAKLVHEDGRLAYQLTSLTKYRKYDQIFISYGPHDNIRLLMEYGFFIPENTLDNVKFHLHDILNVLNISLSDRRYKYLRDHNFDKYDDLYIGYSGFSFNLKAVLFVSFNEEIKHLNSVIFSDCYPMIFLENMPKWSQQLLDYKISIFKGDYEVLRACNFVKTDNALLMESFLQYRIVFANDLKNKLCI